MGDNLVDHMLDGYRAQDPDAQKILDVLRVMNSQITQLPCVKNSDRISDLEKLAEQRKGAWKTLCIIGTLVAGGVSAFVSWLFK